MLAVAAVAALILSPAGAVEAKGCIAGAAAGGVAGHFAHHPILGAVAGCAIGHHIAHRHDRELREQQRAQHGH
ncbi:MAG: hypothetical protein ABI376_04700 [Caulobacteraceae bacterium]